MDHSENGMQPQALPMWLPYLGPEVREAADRALADGYLGLGSLSRHFDEALADFLELDTDRQLMTTNSCTAALHCPCILAGAERGTEVIAPALRSIGQGTHPPTQHTTGPPAASPPTGRMPAVEKVIS